MARMRRKIKSFSWLASAIGLLAVESHGAEFQLPAEGMDLVGELTEVVAGYEDTLSDMARAHGLGFEEITRANPDVDAWLPGEGTAVELPTRFLLPRAPREGIVVNLPELRLYYYPPGGKTVLTFPISIGRMEWGTPLGRAKVVSKVVDPSWYPPESIRQEHAADNRPLPRVVPPGPDNPLGRHAMRLSLPGYLIHGTNKPAGVGMRVTHGCIRMYPEDIAALFKIVPVNTPVRIVNQPYKLGWGEDGLYLEAHPPLDEDQAGEQWTPTAITRLLVEATEERAAQLDWERAESVFRSASGIPLHISQPGSGEALSEPQLVDLYL
jgi:L,D-transpeptidase ErfK/SrfK